MTTLIEDLTDLVSQYEMKKIDRKTLIKALKNIVKHEEKKMKPKKFWLDEFFPEREEA